MILIQSQHYDPNAEDAFLGTKPKPEKLPNNFVIERDKGGNQIIITDRIRNRSVTVSVMCYSEIKKVLTELFGVMPNTETWNY